MLETLEIKTTSPAETERLAGIFAKNIFPGLVFALSGDLGAGKTTFVRALVHATGNQEIVNSPTFTLLNVYGKNPKFYHFDLYRLSALEDLENIGAEELIPATDGITCIEWAERIPEIMPENYLQVSINSLDENSRLFVLKTIGKTIELERIKKQWLS